MEVVRRGHILDVFWNGVTRFYERWMRGKREELRMILRFSPEHLAE